MEIEKEITKITAILDSGKFKYHGKVYELDLDATIGNHLNANLDGKPIKKLVAVGGLTIWSHDVESVAIEVPEYVTTTTEVDVEIDLPTTSMMRDGHDAFQPKKKKKKPAKG